MLKTYLTLALAVYSAFTNAQLSISTLPETPYFTKEGSIQYLEFDFIVSGQKQGKYFLDKIELFVYDSAGNVQQRMKMADEGMVSGFGVFPKTVVKKDKKISLFNPFYFFGDDVQLFRMSYQLTFKKGKEVLQLTKEIRPVEYKQTTRLQLPLKGDVMVDSGFDHYAHHRRLNTTHWGMKLLKLSRNITRYAIDFAPSDPDGNIFENEGKELSDYHGFGQDVYAPAEGVIIEVAKGYPDNEIEGKLPYGFFKFIKNPKLASGNYVVIDHQNGEMSLLAHLKEGSVVVKEGQRINSGDLIGQIGNSGDSTYPHLHYQLENEHGLNTKTYPAKFSGLRFLNGVELSSPVFCNTGDLITH